MQKQQNKRSKKSLGRPQAKFNYRDFNSKLYLLWYIPGVLFICILLSIGIWRTLEGHIHYGPAAAENWGKPWFLYAGLSSPILLLFAIRHIKKQNQSILLYTNGLYLKNFSSSEEIVNWEEISGIVVKATNLSFLGHNLKSHYQLIIYSNSNSPIRLNNKIGDLLELAERIKSKIYPLLYPELRAAFHAGKWLFFGEITVCRDILKVKNREISWDRIHKIGIQAGKLNIELKNKERITIATHKVQNLELLTKLIETDVII